MNLNYYIKESKTFIHKSKLIFFILFLPIITCSNNENIDGKRLDLYQKNMDKYLTYDDRNIILSTQRNIKSMKQVDYGPNHLFQHSQFGNSLTKLWETSLKNSGSISAPIFSNNKIFILDGRANLYSLNLDGQKDWETLLKAFKLVLNQ